jgi:hypothetical protein
VPENEPEKSQDEKKPEAPAPKKAAIPAPLAEALTRRLRESAARKRPRTVQVVLLALGLAAVLVGAVLWRFWPQPDPPRLLVIGFDQVAVCGQPVQVRAAAKLHDGDGKLAGNDIFFGPLTAQGFVDGSAQARTTDASGIAIWDWTASQTESVSSVQISYVIDDIRARWSDRTRGRVFSWPAESRLLLIDVEPLLQKVAGNKEIAVALEQAQAAGWRLVYLALNTETPAAYHQQRDWAIQQLGRAGITPPDGPVLAPVAFISAETMASQRQRLFAALKADFPGRAVFLTMGDSIALHQIAADGSAAGDAVKVDGWGRLAEALK